MDLLTVLHLIVTKKFSVYLARTAEGNERASLAASQREWLSEIGAMNKVLIFAAASAAPDDLDKSNVYPYFIGVRLTRAAQPSDFFADRAFRRSVCWLAAELSQVRVCFRSSGGRLRS
jgi:hypothetical protein